MTVALALALFALGGFALWRAFGTLRDRFEPPLPKRWSGNIRPVSQATQDSILSDWKAGKAQQPRYTLTHRAF